MRIWIFAIIATFFCFSVAHADTLNREAREILMAEQLILLSNSRAASSHIQAACARDHLLCVGTEHRELALALIGARKTSYSLQHLVALLRFNLDGSVGGDLTCYILQNGRNVKQRLRTISPEILVKQCKKEKEDIIKSTGFDDVLLDDVCASNDKIINKKNALLSAINKGGQCNPEDF